MTKLALGVLLWSAVHFVPALAADFRKSMVDRLGEYPWKGLFTVVMAVAIYLLISGWKSASTVEVFMPPAWGGHAAYVLVLLGFILFLAPYPANNFKRLLRHPQLTGVCLWGIGHLAANGEARSIVLFGGLTLWAVIEALLLNRRDGEWHKPEKVSHTRDLALVLFSSLVYMAFIYTHHLIFGGSPLTWSQ